MLTPEQAATVLRAIAEIIDAERGLNHSDPVVAGLLCRVENKIATAVEEITTDQPT